MRLEAPAAAVASDWTALGKRQIVEHTDPQEPPEPHPTAVPDAPVSLRAAAQPWGQSEIWRNAPAFWKRTLLKKTALAAAILLMTFYAASRGVGLARNEWRAARQVVENRAAIVLQEDFQGNLSAWQEGARAAKSWSLADSGIARPGRLALFSPSVSMRDYRLDFSTLITSAKESGARSELPTSKTTMPWIALLKPGPPYRASVIHYPVIAGKPGKRRQSNVSFYMEPERHHSVQVDVQGDHFTTSVDGQIVDSWSNVRLPSGGAGFFCSKGSRAELLQVRVSYQDDSWGALCAFLSPGHTQGSESEQQSVRLPPGRGASTAGLSGAASPAATLTRNGRASAAGRYRY
ncbi:MAG TPA: hypothetical protein VEU62_04225 [Bryobacterales bacterium]|nr:hypothetical protein [Bryobacterales bacterium]